MKTTSLATYTRSRAQRGAALMEYVLGLAAIAMIAVVAVKAAGIKVTRPMCKVTAKGFMGKSDDRWLWSPENTQGRPDCFVSDGFDDYTIWW